MVVANELSTRKDEVIVVSEREKITVRRDKTQAGAEVEKPLIELLADQHSAYIKNLGVWLGAADGEIMESVDWWYFFMFAIPILKFFTGISQNYHSFLSHCSVRTQ